MSKQDQQPLKPRIPSLAKQVVRANDCPKAEEEGKGREGNKVRWRSVAHEDDIINNFLRCHCFLCHFFWQTIGSLYSSTFLVSEPIMSRFEYDLFYRKGQGNWCLIRNLLGREGPHQSVWTHIILWSNFKLTKRSLIHYLSFSSQLLRARCHHQHNV